MLPGILLGSGALALGAWLGVLLLPSQPYRTRERFEPRGSTESEDLSSVAVLIPARNEAAVIGRTLHGLARQGRALSVIVVDDESNDGTAEICTRLDTPLRVDVLAGRPLPPAWGGKLWALEQGLARVERPFVLLLDADIELGAGVVAGLLEKAEREDCALVSIMAELRCEGVWEKLLVPPFIFFFKLLYPFARVNDASRRTAAAAGGCILIRTDVLREIGGFERIRGELIDDCSLAALVKNRARRVWLGLSHAVKSLREYATLVSFWEMVTRTAFTQLGYSAALLGLVTAIMLVMFVAPIAALVAGPTPLARGVGGAALLAMTGAYLPVVRYYRRPAAWTATLPVAALLFLAMTWSSALNYWRGVRAQWKNRDYAV